MSDPALFDCSTCSDIVTSGEMCPICGDKLCNYCAQDMRSCPECDALVCSKHLSKAVGSVVDGRCVELLMCSTCQEVTEQDFAYFKDGDPYNMLIQHLRELETFPPSESRTDSTHCPIYSRPAFIVRLLSALGAGFVSIFQWEFFKDCGCGK